jgi:uncharacterized protein
MAADQSSHHQSSVINNADRQRFEVTVDGNLAELTYRLDGPRLVLVHTGVPPELEGGGVGRELVAAALRFAADEGLVVVPRCPFARRLLERHPEMSEGVEIDWPTS